VVEVLGQALALTIERLDRHALSTGISRSTRVARDSGALSPRWIRAAG
jgi:hypothetical protein